VAPDLTAKNLFYSIDDAFSKSLYLPPDRLADIRNRYQSAETQRAEDYRLVQSLIRRLFNLRTPPPPPPARGIGELGGSALPIRRDSERALHQNLGLMARTLLDIQEISNPLVPELLNGPRAQELSPNRTQPELHDEPLIELG
jgi:hypothetical protein